MRRLLPWLCSLALMGPLLRADEPPLNPTRHVVPGVQTSPYLRYENPDAHTVELTGTWDHWAKRPSMTLSNNVWSIDTRTLGAPPGRHDFKFIVNGEWEQGENRVLYLNDQGEVERPPDLILQATMESRNEIMVYVRGKVEHPEDVHIRLDPDVPVTNQQMSVPPEEWKVRGYASIDNSVVFLFDEKTYGLDIPPDWDVAVAGTFNGWDGSGGERKQWMLHDDDDDGVWMLHTQLNGLRPMPGESNLLFRFVVNRSQWLTPPKQAHNAHDDGRNNFNLQLEPDVSGCTRLKITTTAPLDLSQNYTLIIDGLDPRRIRYKVAPGLALDATTSTKPLGVELNAAQQATTYRLFAPRARAVYLCLFDTPEYEQHQPTYRRLTPRERYPMWKDESDGVWEVSLLGLDTGKYYSFQVDGPSGDGEGFVPSAFLGDPYGLAAAHSMNNTIVIDREATNQWFGGWTDEAWKTPRPQDDVIYETHIRNFTIHPSSMVPAQLRGTYEGFTATAGLGTGLDHLKKLGVNMVEIMPANEFENGTREYGWGYSTVYYFSPEASYGRAPLKGSQYYEFKSFVNEMHRNGLGVIMDVVFNHVGGPNIFSLIDKKYYFRLGPDYRFSNFSGCGNDVRSEAPMMRRFIVDNIKYWMQEHHVDGFRFDLCELIDLTTLHEIEKAARAINTNVVLISEPWSYRGENKRELRGSGWSAWNNDFRYAAKDFARGRADREWLKKCITGSIRIWSDTPIQSINYLESHDDMALADELAMRPDKNGKHLDPYDVSMNRLATTVLMTSLGIPMLAEGQEFLRSKYGLHNTFDKGDAVNALRWSDRERPLAMAAQEYYRGLIALRQSAAGAAFRVAQRPPDSYYQWVDSPEPRALGYIINAPHIHEGNGFIVLANASDYVAQFPLNVPAGRWRVVSDGLKVNPKGLSGYDVISGPHQATIKVPEMRAMILMDGF